MRLWLIPIAYVAASVICGIGLPRIEEAYLGTQTLGPSVSSAQAYLSAAASGMMALTAIVFSLAFVMVQFSAIAYSPRLVVWFVRDRALFHSLGIFVATFIYSLWALAWIDRAGSGTVPPLSTMLAVVMVMLSMVLFARLVQRLNDLQITNVLHLVGDRGRDVIRAMFQRMDELPSVGWKDGRQEPVQLGPTTQTLIYSGAPRTIAKFDIGALVQQAQAADSLVVMKCAVGDTVVDGTELLQVHGARDQLPEQELRRAIKLDRDRTFEQDPKYPIRLLVDIAIKALSPAINDPTTAVQTIDQLEDLLRRLGRRELDAGYGRDANDALRVIFPMPSWEDYLTLAFDEIRQYGAGSIQVMRRLRSALVGLAESLTILERVEAVQRYLKHLDLALERSPFDAEDRVMAQQEDRQGLGLSRKRA